MLRGGNWIGWGYAVGVLSSTFIVGSNAPDQTPSPTFADKPEQAQISTRLLFEPNAGQVDSSVAFVGRGRGRVFLRSDGVTLVAYRATNPEVIDAVEQRVLRLSFMGADEHAEGVGEKPTGGESHYFLGQDSTKWVRNVPHFRRVRFRDVYPGVDVVYYQNENGDLEYDFEVAPGANPLQIGFRFDGSVRTDSGGALSVRNETGTFIQSVPVVYEAAANGRRKPIAAAYEIKGERIGLALGSYDKSAKLVIDPVLKYFTVVAESVPANSADQALDVAIGADGAPCITGRTLSVQLPGSTNPSAGFQDAFVTCFESDGQIKFSTFIGGPGRDQSRAITIGSDIVIAGDTNSIVFPMTQTGFQPELDANPFFPDLPDAFVARLDLDGSNVTFASYFGGINGDSAADVAVLGPFVFIVGGTGSPDLLEQNFATNVKPPLQSNLAPSPGGMFQIPAVDGFLARIQTLQPPGEQLDYATYLGGTGTDQVTGVVTDPLFGLPTVVGHTDADDFPLRDLPSQTTPGRGGGTDAFVGSFGGFVGPSAVTASFRYIGGSGSDTGTGVAVNGAIHVVGHTESLDFPTVMPLSPAGTSLSGNRDVFVSRIVAFTGASTDFDYSTYVGGSGNETDPDIAVDAFGAVIVATTDSEDLEVLHPLQANLSSPGISDGFVVKLSPNGARLFASYLGTPDLDVGLGAALDGTSNIYAAGYTAAPPDPDPQVPTGFNAFVAEISPLSAEDDSFTTLEDATLTVAAPGVLEGDVDINEQTLTAALVADVSNGELTLNADGSFTYEPDLEFSGEDTFTYSATNPDGLTESAVVRIDVVFVNDPPVANSENFTLDEDPPAAITGNILANDTDPESDPLTVVPVANVTNGTLTIDTATGDFSYSPNANFNGTDIFRYRLTDGVNFPATLASTRFFVAPVNDSPVLAMPLGDILAFEDGPQVTIDLASVFADVDIATNADMLTFTVTNANPMLIAPNVLGNTLTVTLAPDASGVSTLTVRATDTGGLFAEDTFQVAVSPVNDTPVATGDSVIVDEDGSVSTDVLANDTGVGDRPITVAVTTGPAKGTVAVNLDNTITYTPVPDFFGTDVYDYTVSDFDGESSTATVDVTVNAVNDVPVAVDDIDFTDEDMSVTTSVLANDSGTGDAPLMLTILSPPVNGTASVNVNLTVTYTPDPDFSGTDSYTYMLTDADGESATATASLTVNPVNDAPVADSRTVAATQNVPFDIVLTGRDVDDCELTFMIVSGPSLGSLGPVMDNMCTTPPNTDTATVAYTSNVTGTDAFTFKVSDGQLDSPIVTVAIVVARTGEIVVNAHTLTTVAGGLSQRETISDSCADPTAPCSVASTPAPLASTFSTAQASSGATRGILTALAAGSGVIPAAQTGDACFGSRGTGDFTLNDLVFTGPEDTVNCNPAGGEVPVAVNLVLNGSIDTMLAAPGCPTAEMRSQVGVEGAVGSNPFSGAISILETDVTNTVMQTGVLSGLTSTQNELFTTPIVCVPLDTDLAFFLQLRTFAFGGLQGSEKSGEAFADFSTTLTLPRTGPVFALPPGVTAESPSGRIFDNRFGEITVVIDIKPEDFPNVIQCEKPKRSIAVAILTTPSFDATTVDHTTVVFEEAAEQHVKKKTGEVQRHEEDVDEDGDVDLLLHFRLGETTLTCDSTQASLTGLTFGGVSIVGRDSVLMKRKAKDEDDVAEEDDDEESDDDGESDDDQSDDTSDEDDDSVAQDDDSQSEDDDDSDSDDTLAAAGGN